MAQLLCVSRGRLCSALQSLTCWLTHKRANFISGSPVGTRTVISKYTSIDTHIYSKTPDAHYVIDWSGFTSEATGSRHDEGSPDQLQLFHLKQSIASKTLIHYQKCMDKIVKYKREKKKRYIDRHNMRTVRQSYFVCIIALMWAIKPKWIWFYCLPYIQCDRCHDQYLWFVSHQPSMA